MKEVLEILLLIAAPLAWGLFVEWLFELLRRRRTNTAGGNHTTSDDGTG
ncbi:MAG: hypothetical protein ACP5HU_11820 [Phycisphaerae bacterium]